MQIKVTAYFVLFTCLVSSLMGKTLYRKGCFECEEEEWEEVPCENIPSNKTTVTPSPAPVFKPTVRTTTTQQPSTTKATPAPRTKPYPTPTSTESTLPKDPYKKCYCECKVGCKEFCRKVILNPHEKQIVQVSKILEPVNEGRIVTTHILQRELIPKSEQNYEPAGDNYIPEPVAPAIKPIYSPYAVSETVGNNIDLFDSYPPAPLHSQLYNSPITLDTYNFPVPFENVYSKMSKNLLNPIQKLQISLHAPSGKDENVGTSSVIGSPLQAPASLDNIDDSLATFLKEVIGSSPTNEATYQSYPSYSVSYNR